MSKAQRERVNLASKGLLDSLQRLVLPLERWTDKAQTQAEVETFILDFIYQELPTPPFTEAEKIGIAKQAYDHVWQQGIPRRASWAAGA